MLRLFNNGQWICLCLMLAFFFVLTDSAMAESSSSEPEEIWLAVKLNKIPQKEELLFLRQADGRVLVSVDDWQKKWHLKPASVSVMRYQEQDFYDLGALQGVTYQLNTQELFVAIQVDISWFKASTFAANTADEVVKPVYSKGFALNYELLSAYNAHAISSSVVFDKVLFGPEGVLESQLIGRDLENGQRELIRLNTTLVRDNLDKITTLKIGDISTFGSGLRFAGLQWGSNFALRPKMEKAPLPSISAEALLPSTVDVYINKAKSLSRSVPTGPFTLENIPVMTGKGNVVVLVKDILGREQTLIVPYHIDAGLLRVGLHEFSTELGFLREEYGNKSTEYGSFFASAFYRKGLTPRLTVEVQGQWQEDLFMLRSGNVFLVPQVTAIQSWIAHSWHQIQGSGYALGVDANAQYKSFNFSADWQYQNQAFRTLGMQDSEAKTQQILGAFVGVSLKKYGSLNSQYTYTKDFTQNTSQRLQIGYSLGLGKYGFLSAIFGQNLVLSDQREFQIGLSIPLFNKQNIQINTQPLDNRHRISVQKNMPTGTGFGYSFTHETGAKIQNHGDLAWQNPYGSYRLRAVEQDGEYSGDLGLSGAVVYLGGQSFVSRQIDNSFAVAKVADYADVKVYSSNHVIGKTNSNGIVLVPRLLAYQKNKLRIGTSDLPFDAEMTVEELEITPAYRSGVWVEFPVKRSYAATMTILLDNGQPLPAGAEVYKQNSREAFPVGYRGELYITGLSAHNTLTAEWKGQKCTFDVAFTMVDDSLPDLGNYLCKGIAP